MRGFGEEVGSGNALVLFAGDEDLAVAEQHRMELVAVRIRHGGDFAEAAAGDRKDVHSIRVARYRDDASGSEQISRGEIDQREITAADRHARSGKPDLGRSRGQGYGQKKGSDQKGQRLRLT